MPVELLSRILLQVIDTVDDESKDICDAAARTTIMLVCRLLRDILLDSPLVWSKIDMGWPRLQYELYMTRARGTPLHVRDHNTFVDPHLYFSLARFIDLEFPEHPSTLKPKLKLQREAPALEILRIAASTVVGGNPCITSTFLGGHPHSLRELTLVSCQVISAPNFSGLKRLTLYLCLEGDRTWSLFDLFPNTPQLEDLSIMELRSGAGNLLHRMDPDWILVPQGDHIKMLLPRLLRLSLSDSAVPVWCILRALNDPALELNVSLIQLESEFMGWQYHDNVLAHVKDWWKPKACVSGIGFATYVIDGTLSDPPESITRRLSYHGHAADAFHVSFSVEVSFIKEFENVNALRFLQDEDLPSCIMRAYQGGLDNMPNIRTVIIENPTGDWENSDAAPLETLIEERRFSSQPIQEIKFEQCTDAIRPYTAQLATRWPEITIFWNTQKVKRSNIQVAP
jgi:hypothetical protein